MKVGNHIRTKGIHSGLEGKVIRIREGVDKETPGTIDVVVTRVTDRHKYNWLDVGDRETFSHHGWQDDMDILA